MNYDKRKHKISDFFSAPPLVQFVKLAGAKGIPIGADTINEAIDKHPEYFPKEAEHRRKWLSIPQHVHDAFHEEYRLAYEDVYRHAPEWNRGLMACIQCPQEYEQYRQAIEPFDAQMKIREENIHKKYYAQYLD